MQSFIINRKVALRKTLLDGGPILLDERNDEVNQHLHSARGVLALLPDLVCLVNNNQEVSEVEVFGPVKLGD